jgi:hypothetical protein
MRLAFEQRIIRAQRACIIGYHQWDSVAYCIGQPIGPANEFLRVTGADAAQRTFADWANKQIK